LTEQISAALAGDAVGLIDHPGRLALHVAFRRDRQALLLVLPAQKPCGQFLFLLSDEAHISLPQ
jgi:hypothetical protein